MWLSHLEITPLFRFILYLYSLPLLWDKDWKPRTTYPCMSQRTWIKCWLKWTLNFRCVFGLRYWFKQLQKTIIWYMIAWLNIFTFVFTTVSYLCAVTTVQIRIFDSCPIIKPSWRNAFFQCTSVPLIFFHPFQSQEIIKFCRIADYMWFSSQRHSHKLIKEPDKCPNYLTCVLCLLRFTINCF